MGVTALATLTASDAAAGTGVSDTYADIYLAAYGAGAAGVLTATTAPLATVTASDTTTGGPGG